MVESDEEKYIQSILPELLNGKAIPRFGTLLRQVCDAVGISQPKLEAYAQAEYDQLEKDGFFRLYPNANRGSMIQEVISRVIKGKQPPSYCQTYIWIKVIKAHYNNPKVKVIFDDMDLEMPEFTSELENALWTLSGHQSPQAVTKAVFDFMDFSPIPRKLPRGVDITPQTDANMQIVQRITKDLAKIKEQEAELQC